MPSEILRANYYYVGNFDDEILRFNDVELDLNTINATLAQAALGASPLLINDGYLMHHAAGREALTNRETSPLLDLMDVGFVQIFSRTGGNLANMPYEMQHIPNYAKLLKDPGWPAMEEHLMDNQDRWRIKGAIVTWSSKDVGPGFQRLINIAFSNLGRAGLPEGLGEEQVSDLLAHFNQRLDNDRKLAARSTWTDLFRHQDFGFSDAAQRYLHWIGIEAYAYNLGMFSSLSKPPGSVAGVITRYSNLFTGVQAALVESEKGARWFELPRPEIAKGLYEELLTNGKFLASLRFSCRRWKAKR